jgi:hypothetical protein
MYQEKVFIDLTEDDEWDVYIRLEEMERRLDQIDAAVLSMEEYLLMKGSVL